MLKFSEFMNEASGDKEAYQKFFNGMLKKFGVKSPSELDDKKKNEFYNAIDKGWDAAYEDCADDEDDIEEGKFASNLIAKALKIAKKSTGDFDKAWAQIEKIKKGLADFDVVAKALKTANENKND
jgi:hypothetical protein